MKSNWYFRALMICLACLTVLCLAVMTRANTHRAAWHSHSDLHFATHHFEHHADHEEHVDEVAHNQLHDGAEEADDHLHASEHHSAAI